MLIRTTLELAKEPSCVFQNCKLAGCKPLLTLADSCQVLGVWPRVWFADQLLCIIAQALSKTALCRMITSLLVVQGCRLKSRTLHGRNLRV